MEPLSSIEFYKKTNTSKIRDLRVGTRLKYHFPKQGLVFFTKENRLYDNTKGRFMLFSNANLSRLDPYYKPGDYFGQRTISGRKFQDRYFTTGRYSENSLLNLILRLYAMNSEVTIVKIIKEIKSSGPKVGTVHLQECVLLEKEGNKVLAPIESDKAKVSLSHTDVTFYFQQNISGAIGLDIGVIGREILELIQFSFGGVASRSRQLIFRCVGREVLEKAVKRLGTKLGIRIVQKLSSRLFRINLLEALFDALSSALHGANSEIVRQYDEARLANPGMKTEVDWKVEAIVKEAMHEAVSSAMDKVLAEGVTKKIYDSLIDVETIPGAPKVSRVINEAISAIAEEIFRLTIEPMLSIIYLIGPGGKQQFMSAMEREFSGKNLMDVIKSIAQKVLMQNRVTDVVWG